jgi:UDP-N-acetyl-2-amino-2-deoxyglucuronate dehydrogenase
MAQVKFALVGCGRVSSRHVDALTNKVPGAKIVAVCDIVPERAEKYSLGLHVPAFTSTAEMYRSVEADVVDIATPSGDHYERVMEALSFDKHVVVEKPLALRLDQADEMIREARERDRKLWVAFQNRYNPAVVKAKEVVDSGRLGKLVIGTVRVRWCRDQSYYDQDDWHGTWAMDGGVISQQAIHHIDALRWFMGEIESVEAMCSTRLVEIECEDLCVAMLRFENGALGIVEAMTAARPRDMEASLSIMGENGSIILGGLALNQIDFWEFVSPQAGDKWIPELFSHEVPNAYGYGHDVLYSRVVESVLQNAPVEISAEEGCKALEVLHAIYASHELGCRVALKDQPVSSRLGIG